MTGLTLGAICIVIGLVAWLVASPSERHWYDSWRMPGREVRAAIPAGVLGAFLIMAFVVAATIAAGPAPR